MNALIKTEEIKKEAIYMGIAFLLLSAILKIIFLQENIIIVLRTAFSMFWLFVLPGFVIMYNWHDKLDFIERLIIGTVLGMAIVGVIGYNLSVLGLNMRYQAALLPPLAIAAGIVIIYRKKEQ